MSGVHDIAAGLLRRLEPETAHRMTVRALAAGLGPRPYAAARPRLAVDLCGLPLPNCVGLAAGFDKNAEVADAMLSAGFGFVECGTVTPRPQVGNPRPRLFRLEADGAVINRMGFNNDGVEAFARRLERRARRGVVGANIGANKDSEDRIADYVAGLRRLWGLADYFTVNISSPNTPGLRSLQTGEALGTLLGRLAEARGELTERLGPAPVFLKIAPDLEAADIADLVETAVRFGLDAIIVSNTTLARPAALTSPLAAEAGGLSGAPLEAIANRALSAAFRAARGRLALVGAGGIRDGAGAYAKIRLGARAVQLYSAMVFAGPGLVQRILAELDALLARDGYAHVAEAVGADHD